MSATRVIDASGANALIEEVRGGIEIGGHRVPLEEVAVLLIGEQCTISGAALAMLAKYDVAVLNVDWRGIPNLVGFGWSDNSRVAARHIAQAELSLPRRKHAWQQIVRAKIQGQANNLHEIGSPMALRLENLRRDVRSGDSSNAEAQAARIYWAAYFGQEDNFRRVPQGQDRVNSLLNYGYVVLRGFVIQAIATAGLWPTYGLWHRNRGNTFALADDLIEPFRAAVDHRIFLLPPTATLDDPEVKRTLVAVCAEPMGSSGATVRTRIQDFASQLAGYCEGNHERLNPPEWIPSQDELADALES